MKKFLDFMAGFAPGHGPRRTAVVCATLAAVLFIVSAVLQLQAAYTRWVLHADGFGEQPLSIESDQYDYFFGGGPNIAEPIPGTGQPMGIGLLLQAAGMLLLLGCLAALGERFSRRILAVLLLLGVFVAASYAYTGLRALDLLLGWQLAAEPWFYIPGDLLLFGGFLALATLCLLCFRPFPAAAICCFFLLGTTIPGYLAARFIVAPLIVGYTSHDTTPGTETVMAITSGVAGLVLLIAVAALARQRALRQKPTPRSQWTAPGN